MDLHGTEAENGDGQEASMLEKVLTNLVYSGDDLPLVDFDIGENKVKSFKGTIEVEGAKEKEKFNLFGKLMGLFSAEKNLEGIFTGVKLIINGDVVANENNTIVNLDELDESISIGLEFDWELPDNGVGGFELKEGDWAEIQLPAIFKGVTGHMEGPLKDGSEVVGTYEITDDGMLTVVFGDHDGFLKKTDRKGTVGFILDFVMKPFNDNSTQLIEFGEPIDKTFIIKVKPSGKLASISKSGSPNEVTNADAIKWIIDVNTSLESLTYATVKDSIPEGLELEGDIEIYHLKVGIDGSLNEGDLKDEITPTDKNNLVVTLGEIDTAYRIKYSTKITDYSKPGYTNTAELFNGEEKKAESTVTVDKVEQGAAISKRSSPPASNATSIKWEIDVNKGEETLKNVMVEDVLQENLTVKADSIKIFKLYNDEGSWVTGDQVNSFNTTKFPLSLGNLEKTDVYRIEFETDIEYMDYKEINTFQNKAILKADKEVDGGTVSEQVWESTASATVYRDPIIIKEGKEIPSYSNEPPVVEWTIKINGANHHIYGAVLTDTIGSGLELIEDSIEIVPNSFQEGYPIYSYPTETEGNNIMEIRLGDITSSYTITYKTKIKSTKEDTFTNHAELTGTGKHGFGEDGKEVIYPVEKDVTVPPRIVNNSYSKKAVSIDYSNKTMTWQIEIDAVKEALTELTITDTFEGKYMVFINDDFSVTKGDDATLAEDTHYTLTNKNVEGFVLEFKEAALGKGKYVIKYKTSFDPNMIIEKGGTPKADEKSIYKNKVKLTGTLKESVGEGTKPLNKYLQDAHTLHQDIYNVGKKEGKLDRDQKEITWRIYVNAQSRNLIGKEFKVTDTIGEGHTFKTGSLSVKEFTLKPGGILSVDDANGITIKEDAIIPAYTVIPDTPNNLFTLTFAGGIDKAYLIEYQTEIKGITKPNYKNSAVITDSTGIPKTYSASVYYKDHNVFITKEALNADKGKVYADDELNWKAVVNESLSEINNAQFTDTISPGHVYVNGSLKVYKGTIAEDNLLTPDETADADAKKYKLGVTTNDGITTIKVGLGNIKSRYIIIYDTAVINSSGVITNTAKLTGTELSDQSTGIKKFNITKTSWGTGTGVSALRGAIKIKKVDNASPANPVKGAEFELFYKVNATDTTWHKVDEKFYTGVDGTLTIGNLPKGRIYKLVETKAPDGYKMKAVETDYSREITVVANDTTQGADIVNERIRDITVKKVWIGPGKTGNGASTATFTLKANGADIGKTLTLITATGWTGKFEGLDYYDASGIEIVYTVEETPIAGYQLLTGNPVKSAVDNLGNFTYTFNNKNMEKISIPVEKVWRKDDAKTITDSINVILSPTHKDNGVDYNYSLTLEKTETWKGTFTNLTKYDDEGKEIAYTIKEEPVTGFKSVISGNKSTGYIVTNIELMDIPVTKKWIGTPKDNTVTIELWEMNGANYGSKVSGKDIKISGDKIEHATWIGLFTGIPKYKVDGTPIQYGIKEVVPSGFKQVSIERNDDADITKGFTITNMELVNVKVTKRWIGALVAGDIINIQLYKQVGFGAREAMTGKSILVTGTNNQSYTFKDLDKYEVSGGNKTEIVYSVDEDLSGYTDKYAKEITGSGLDYTITNRNIEKISIPVEKVWWIDATTTLPTSVQIQLSNDKNAETKNQTLDIENSWKHTFDNLFKYDQTSGESINYTVKELYVDESKFETQYQGNQNSTEGIKVINIELMDIDVEKIWIGTPKDNVEISLYEGDTKIGAPITISSPTWKATFTGIPKYKANGDPIIYTVKETEITGYETTYAGSQKDGFTITNRQLTDIKASKAWVNGEEARPDSVKLQLFRKVGDETLSEVGDPVVLNGTETLSWTHTWKNLYATDESGIAYTYTVDEVAIPTNYNKAVTGNMADGFTITNTYESPKINITATKEWIGGPTTKPDIWFKLYRKIDTEVNYSEVSESSIQKLTSGTTTVTWASQPENDPNGNPYTYKVKEVTESGGDWKPDNYIKTENLLTVTNSYNSPMNSSLKAIKVWDGGSSPKPIVWFKLYRTTDINTAPVEVPTSEVADAIKELADGKTEVVWTGLKKTDKDGIPYIYSVKEVDSSGVEFVPEKYKVSYKYNDTKTEQTITNTYVSPKIQISIKKVWEDGPKPEIEIELYRNGVYLESKKLNGTETTPWTHIWELDKTDKDGKDYVYSVKEVPVDNYTTEIDGSVENKFTITNTYEIPKIDIIGTKVWVGGSSTRPTVELQLYRDGVKHGAPVELNGKEGTPWTKTWEGLDKTDIDGKEYKYTVDEVNIPSYYYKTISADGLTITNTYSPPEEPYYPDPKPDPKPDPDPDPKPDPDPDPDPKPDPEPPVDPPVDPEETPTVKEETPKDTPKEGEVEVPEDSAEPPKVNNPPEHGTVTVDENGKWTYTPEPGFVGKDKFSIIVTKPDGTEEEIFFEIDVEDPLGTLEPEKPTLPKTGETNSILFYLAGLFLVIVGIVLRRKTV